LIYCAYRWSLKAKTRKEVKDGFGAVWTLGWLQEVGINHIDYEGKSLTPLMAMLFTHSACYVWRVFGGKYGFKATLRYTFDQTHKAEGLWINNDSRAGWAELLRKRRGAVYPALQWR
jgi:hypothetical protein